MDIALRGVFLYAFVVFLMRVMGRRELSSLSPLVLVLLIVLGDAIQQGLTQDDYSVTGAMITIASIAAIQVILGYLAFRSRRIRTILEGEPVVLVEDGRIIDKNLRRARIAPVEL